MTMIKITPWYNKTMNRVISRWRPSTFFPISNS